MRFAKWLALAVSVITLAACQTVPLYDTSKKAFSTPASKESGLIRISTFGIPKDEPGTTLLHILAAAGGGDINYPISASIYDVTDETRYIGTMGMGRDWVWGGWIEHEAPAGKRTLMLTLAAKSSIYAESLGTPHTDFIEVEVKPSGVSHVSLSRYGFKRYPYLGEIALSDKNRDYCLALQGKRSEREKAIEGYMAENGLDPNARDFKRFCLTLSDPKTILVANDEARRQLAEQRSRIEALRKEAYGKWQAEGEKRPPYDLMRIYPPATWEQ